MHVLMVAAENDALPNAKVGGVADVIRDCPRALAKEGLTVDVVIPDYGFDYLERVYLGSINMSFAGDIHQVDAWQVKDKTSPVRQLMLSHPYFSQHRGQIYCDDPQGQPFATDATKFALFNAAVCEALLQGIFKAPDVIHLHDWHSACVAVLLKFMPRFETFSHIKMVYTVHNIALQGTRPFQGDPSSLHAWFPNLQYNAHVLCDPRYPHCFNPMRSGINLADKVHLVSPTYASEVLSPSQPSHGFFGGEGLERDLHYAKEQHRLVGILNGCEYPRRTAKDKVDLTQLYEQINSNLLKWMASQHWLLSSHYIAHQRLQQFMQTDATGPLVTSVGRLTDQKVLLLRQPYQNQLVIDELCQQLAQHQGRMIIIGSGADYIEDQLTQSMAKNDNLLFLKGYSPKVGDMLYKLGQLFLMPSSFEPCGISQMLAMREGQPCLVHQVGGLKDTVIDQKNGFAFSGESLQEQSQALIDCFAQTLDLYASDQKKWQAIAKKAKASRFTWANVAQQYISELYTSNP